MPPGQSLFQSTPDFKLSSLMSFEGNLKETISMVEFTTNMWIKQNGSSQISLNIILVTGRRDIRQGVSTDLRQHEQCSLESLLTSMVHPSDLATGHPLLCKGDSHTIEHGDTSLNNLTVDPHTLGGVLPDFDLPRISDKNEESVPQGTGRTGTVPFMALDLLCEEYWEGKIERVYRHDLESFAWVIIYLGYTNDETLKPLPVVDWYTSDYEECRRRKRDFLFRSMRTVTDSAHIVYGSQQPWLLAMELMDWVIAVEIKRTRDQLMQLRSTMAIADDSREDMEADGARERTELLNVFAKHFMEHLDLRSGQAFNEWLKLPADDACRAVTPGSAD
ncbi:hypothetical protein PUNSTDRAFT_135209 [Punctularia strigosozonata HHB-11173 SS5]|uniref:uncharacterized protein n=1 Tax=Punctularia strigosozonata (strain HHB-11173) TaxID=741275 RepID=UPI000441743E|nr:uncharacterized protein PUNSTDRAFT_135209 [Punctularia strigosozonata HHB-11173 SS5]EIN07688.1 hypothetical protein PUNSTDRAFT_135209 [Punctularia strigosozonata HHB-11173 SS5]